MSWTLVTGGARGVGRAICLSLAENGYDVIVHYNTSRKEALEVVACCRKFGVSAEAIQGDFASRTSLDNFIKRYRRRFRATHNLVNNVGNYLVARASETSEDEWYALFQTNLHAPFAISKALLPSLQRHHGSIINIGFSGVNYLRADSHSTAYNVTKSALWMLTRSLAFELAPLGIRVNMVSPGHLENSVDKPLNPRALPMHRLGTLSEVVRVVVFLLQDESGYITGQNIDVAGGVRL